MTTATTTPSDWPGVFISSTCYDLIDLRAEVEAHVKDLGLKPYMSERLTSEFEVDGVSHSIKVCVENVKKCPTFVCILSQRYGRTVESFGYPGLSATHVEYRTAVAEKKKVFLYVRDRFVADFETWRTAKKAGIAPPSKLPWVDVKDYALFDLYEEHLAHRDDATNWVWTFSDSLDLKARLSIDLRSVSRSAQLQRLVDKEALPLMQIRCVEQTSQPMGEWYYGFEIENHGRPAFDVTLEVGGRSTSISFVGDRIVKVGIKSAEFRKGPRDHLLTLTYAISSGARIRESRVFVETTLAGPVRADRRLTLLDGSAIVIE